MIKIIDFKYINELQLFTQILVLGSVLSVIVMYITELTKKIITISENKSWIFTIICLAISIFFGIAWARTFAYDSMSITYSLWLGIFLWLGSTGFYTKLEEKNGFWGKTVQSYSQYLEKRLNSPQPSTPADGNNNQTPNPPASDTPQTPAAPEPSAPQNPTTPTPSPPADQQKYIVYTVVKGDTLWDLGVRYNVDYREIAYLNNIEDPSKIYPGMILIIPVTSSAPAPAPSPAPAPEAVKFRYPVNYIAISEPFSSSHYGVDFGYSASILGPNQAIYAAIPGKILVAAADGGTAGTYIKLQFDDTVNNCTWYTYYKHLSSMYVQAGDVVAIGQKIGLMGNTGGDYGNHLHFDLVKVALNQSYDNNNKSQRAQYSVNPIDYLYVDKDQIIGDVTATKYNFKFI